MRTLAFACLTVGLMTLGSLPAAAAEPPHSATPNSETSPASVDEKECCCKKMMKKTPEQGATKEGEHKH